MLVPDTDVMPLQSNRIFQRSGWNSHRKAAGAIGAGGIPRDTGKIPGAESVLGMAWNQYGSNGIAQLPFAQMSVSLTFPVHLRTLRVIFAQH